MQIATGDVALITGASRGLGVYIARALSTRGMNLVLCARSEEGLKQVAEEMRSAGAEVLTVVADVSDLQGLQTLAAAAHERFGRVDVLVNNASMDHALPYDRVSVEHIQSMLQINTMAPLILTRLLLPGMLENERGHIVNIASLAGLMGSPYEELYTATKHALVGFTRSLRLSARDMHWPVSASVICPGFMDAAGIYEDMKREHGVTAPAALGSLHAGKLGEAVIRAIEKDRPDVLVARGAPRIAAAIADLFPRFYEFLTEKLDTASLFRAVAKAHTDAR